MYGTIAQLKVKPGMAPALIEAMKGRPASDNRGMIGAHVYKMDSNPDEHWLAVLFESKEAYVANAESPEQHDEYLKMRSFLTEDPVWHDGEVIDSLP